MSRILVVSSSHTGGDLNVLVAVALGLRERGHDVHFVGDRAVATVLQGMDISVSVLPPHLDLREHMLGVARAIKKEKSRAGDIFLERLLDWVEQVTPAIVEAIRQYRPNLVLTPAAMSPLTDRAAAMTGVPWGLVNSSFYVGPGAENTVEDDYSGLVVPMMRYCFTVVERASLAVHATPRLFNTDRELPPNHRCVGSLGWEAPEPAPGYLQEPGDPWALVTLSLMTQNDIPIAQAALDALADRPVRVVVTLGADHSAEELSAIPRNARVERSVPHSAVLDHGALLVSPGSAGAVVKALQRGVPMVLVPLGMDRPGVARRAERLGVARVVPHAELTRETMSDALEAVLIEPGYRRVAQDIAQHLQGQNPVADSCAHIEAFLSADTLAG